MSQKIYQFAKTPLGQLLMALSVVLLFGGNMPYAMQKFLWTVAVMIRDFLNFLLPYITLIFFLNSFSHFIKNFSLFLFQISITMLTYLCVGAFAYVSNAWYIGKVDLHYMELAEALKIYSWYGDFWPKILTPTLAMQMAFVLGIMSYFYHPIQRFSEKAIITVRQLFKILSKATPFLLLGSLIKLRYDGAFNWTFLSMLVVMITTSIIWIGSLYLFYYKFNFVKVYQHLKSFFPVGVLGLTTSSSAICLPLLEEKLNQKVQKKDSLFFLPNLINVHLVGENLFRTTMMLTIHYSTYHCFPGFMPYMKFTIILACLKLAMPPAASSSIILAKPYAMDYLKFDDRMYNQLFNCYMPFNSLLVFFNIYGNAIFPLILEKIRAFFVRK